MPLPQQVTPGNNRKAHAPYNFVPLPEGIRKVELPPDRDIYYPSTERYTGYINVELETLTPLYVRGMFPLDRFVKQQRDEEPKDDFKKLVRNKPEFFSISDPGEPIIPGSSLRGMLRTLVEVISYGKLTRVSEKRLFFRTADGTSLSDYYGNRIGGNIQTGFMREAEGRYFIKVCDMLRVKRSGLTNNIGELYDVDKDKSYRTPTWDTFRAWHQHMPIWVLLDSEGYISEVCSDDPTGDAYLPARLVITGDIPKKKREFIFLKPEDEAEEVEVPQSVIDLFQDDDQITQWQEKAFNKDKPNKDARKRDGLLLTDLSNWGDPVFFLREDSQMTFFGRAGMFRLPYNNRPLDLVPENLRNPVEYDLAEAIFGYVRSGDELKVMKEKGIFTDAELQQGKKPRAYAGRVFVTEAKLQTGQSEWEGSEFSPEILATPKPTSFQQYLVQESDNKRRLAHYDNEYDDEAYSETAIRGHKFYWHRGRKAIDKLTAGDVGSGSTQHTRIKPVKAGKKFSFKVHFENLSEVELGALLWALQPQGDAGKKYRHKLGMGKPLGMGSIELRSTLYLRDRTTRYETLFEGNQWAKGSVVTLDVADLLRSFEQFVLSSENNSERRLADENRIKALLKMMEWDEIEKSGRDYANLNDFRDRRVLPDPLDVD